MGRSAQLGPAPGAVAIPEASRRSRSTTSRSTLRVRWRGDRLTDLQNHFTDIFAALKVLVRLPHLVERVDSVDYDADVARI